MEVKDISRDPQVHLDKIKRLREAWEFEANGKIHELEYRRYGTDSGFMERRSDCITGKNLVIPKHLMGVNMGTAYATIEDYDTIYKFALKGTANERVSICLAVNKKCLPVSIIDSKEKVYNIEQEGALQVAFSGNNIKALELCIDFIQNLCEIIASHD